MQRISLQETTFLRLPNKTTPETDHAKDTRILYEECIGALYGVANMLYTSYVCNVETLVDLKESRGYIENLFDQLYNHHEIDKMDRERDEDIEREIQRRVKEALDAEKGMYSAE